MSTARTRTDAELQLPVSLEDQFRQFRKRVWTIKAVEAICGGLFGILASFLAVFVLDRFWDTPLALRIAIFALATTACALVAVYLHRWIWGHRRLEQLARLLSKRYPLLGDQLLGIIELVHNQAEQARSRALCEAAIDQVAHEAETRNFEDAIPQNRYRLWIWLAAVPSVAAVALLVIFPAAAANAWARFILPWQNTPRYTFAFVERLPERLVVAHGEPFALPVRLAEDSPSRPQRGTMQLGTQNPVSADLREGTYVFDFPSQIDSARLSAHIGDSFQSTRVEPMLRPELNSIEAEITLPEYLGRSGQLHKDVRGGSISVVNGSDVTFVATANRKLSAAKIDGEPRNPVDATLTSPPEKVDGSRKVEFQWEDEYGLAGKAPFTLSITGREDEAPSITCEDLPRSRVILDSETLTFKVRAADDFGVKRVGIEWQGIDDPTISHPAQGERLLAAGAHDKDLLEAAGTFSAQALEIEPQPISVRLFVEDYLPGRERVYSSPYMFLVLNAEQHSIWITDQLSKWHRQSLEVRDRELQLFETNKQLRDMEAEELDQPENRRRLESQANAERANGRRLNNLVASGEELVRQAMRNPEFGVGHLDKWAEMLQILKDISSNRMPSVAELLKQGAQAPRMAMAATDGKSPPAASQARDAAQGQPKESKSAPKQGGQAPKLASVPTDSKSPPMAGEVRDTAQGQPKETKPDPNPKPANPKVMDVESNQQPAKPKEEEEKEEPGKAKPPSPLRLPVTTIMSAGKKKKQGPPTPAEEKVDEAVQKQEDLLAEFDKIAEELNRVLANLEGSTLVKRLKAASRLQYRIAGRISDQLKDAFGLAPSKVPEAPTQALQELSDQESKGSRDISNIMDDMHAYFERRQFQRFKSVLEEMKAEDPIGSLRQLGDDLKKEEGVSIAQCEFWSDTFDRWADDLVDPACCGKCPGCKGANLPPSVVLEVLQILEGEVNLREETRVTEQAKQANPFDFYGKQAAKLSKTQDGLKDRTEKVTQVIRELENGEVEFAKEIALLTLVASVMDEATGILARPETGKPAIAAETEVIELLLKSKRVNPNGGGGGGANPGGGGGGSTFESALALIGTGVNDKEVREDHGISQTTGDVGKSLPEEFRAGLDEYFNRLDK